MAEESRETDAELFLCREREGRVDVHVVGATRFSLPASRAPRSVTLSEAGAAWRQEKDRLLLTVPESVGAVSAAIAY